MNRIKEAARRIYSRATERTRGAGERNVTYRDVLWLFVMGSVVGFVLEGLWHLLRIGRWESHTATVWGPFCIIYGIGTAIAYVLSSKIKDKPLGQQFIIYGAAGSLVEYFGSLFQEVCFGMSSWDYSDHFLNIGGRVSLWMTLLWAILGISFAIFVFPLFDRILHKMKGKYWRIATIAVTVFMSADLIFTALTVWRWNERQEDLPASNVFEEFVDQRYNDDKMADIFPNWSFPDTKTEKE